MACPVKAADPWDATDKILFGAGVIASGADMVSTQKFLDEGFKEGNPILGEHPSDGRLVVYFATLTLVHYVVGDFLPSEWAGRKGYLLLVFLAHSWAARHNIMVCNLTW